MVVLSLARIMQCGQAHGEGRFLVREGANGPEVERVEETGLGRVVGLFWIA